MRALALALVLVAGCAESHLRGEDAAISMSEVTAPCASPSSGSSRDCGWRADETRSCTPGASVTIACSAACGLGACTGDAMIRVCAGATDCTRAGALAQNDDACGTLCPQVTATCPPEGILTVLTAPFSSSSSYECAIGVTR